MKLRSAGQYPSPPAGKYEFAYLPSSSALAVPLYASYYSLEPLYNYTSTAYPMASFMNENNMLTRAHY